MNWIKIDYGKLENLPLNTTVKVAENSGKQHIGEFIEKSGGGIDFKWICKIPLIEDLIFSLKDYAIIEKPKRMKYNSIEEFWEKSGVKYFYSDQLNGVFEIEIFLTNDDFVFKGKSFTECEQKILDWANDELQQWWSVAVSRSPVGSNPTYSNQIKSIYGRPKTYERIYSVH